MWYGSQQPSYHDVKRLVVQSTVNGRPSSEDGRSTRHRFPASGRLVGFVRLLVRGRREVRNSPHPVRLGIVANDLVSALSSSRAQNCLGQWATLPLGTEAARTGAPPGLGHLRSHSLTPPCLSAGSPILITPLAVHRPCVMPVASSHIERRCGC